MASKGNSSRDGDRGSSRRTSRKPTSSDPNTVSGIARLSSSSSTRLSLEEAQLAEVKAREDRSRDDELQYFTVETKCLGCKKKLTAQVVELHGRLTCPRCQAIMHMGPDGKWHKGPPPSYILKAPKITRWHRLSYRFPFLRKRSVQAGAGVVILALFAVVLFCLFRGPQVELPPQVVPRSRALGEFITTGDYQKFKQFLASGTTSEGRDWFNQLHAVVKDYKAQQYTPTVDTVEPIFENHHEGRANVKVTLHFRPRTPQDPELTLPVLLAWQHDEEKQWVLNGTETLKHLAENR